MKQKALYRIYNLKTDATFFGISDDAENVCASERFMLDLGMHPCASLQKDYTDTGLELFVIEIVTAADDEKSLTARKAELEKELEARGIEVYR